MWLWAALASRCKHCLAMSMQAKSAMKLAEIGHGVVVTPSMDQLLRSGHPLLCTLLLLDHDAGMNADTGACTKQADPQVPPAEEALLKQRRGVVCMPRIKLMTQRVLGNDDAWLVTAIWPCRKDSAIPDWPRLLSAEKPAKSGPLDEAKLDEVRVQARSLNRDAQMPNERGWN